LSFAQFMYFVLIVGCELDIMGFCLGAVDYWPKGNAFMKLMLIVGPLGYITGIMMNQFPTYWHWLLIKPETAHEPKETKHPLLQDDLPPNDPSLNDSNGQSDGNSLFSDDGPGGMQDIEKGCSDAAFKKGAKYAATLPTHLPNPPVSLEFYHFTPIARYYLLLKEATSGDVEGLFRVNALSTFTFGFAQMTCLALGLSSGVLQLNNILIEIGLLAQCVNGVVTLVYFVFQVTVVKTMKDSVQVASMKYRVQTNLKDDFAKFTAALDLHNKEPSEDTEHAILYFRKVAVDEAKRLANLPEVDIDLFTMAELLQLRRRLWQRNLQEYIQV